MADQDGEQAGQPAEETAEEATRRRFREALDRKKYGHHGGGSGGRDPKAKAPHQSPAKPQRTFRNKSG
jgi:Family of unknown function (DUF5302)